MTRPSPKSPCFQQVPAGFQHILTVVPFIMYLEAMFCPVPPVSDGKEYCGLGGKISYNIARG